MPDESSSSGGAQAVLRAVKLLKLIASEGGDGLRLADIAERAVLERPTAHRLLKALISESMVAQDKDSKRYRLGPLVFELGLAAAHQFNLNELARPALERLAQKTGDTSFLFVRSGNDAVCLLRIQGHFPIQTPAVPVGSRQPLGVNAGGLALLSQLPDGEIDEILDKIAPRLPAFGGLDPQELKRLVQRARGLGYALIGEYAVPGVTAVGLPVFSRTRTPVAALTVAALTSRMTPARQREILPLLKSEAQRIAELLGQ